MRRLGALALVALAWPGDLAQAQFFRRPTATQEAPPPPAEARLTYDAWKQAPTTPATPAEIDQLILKELTANQIKPAPLTSDEQFIRRVTLDLTGALPTTADVSAFVADTAADKRAQLIDRLLDSDRFARHWARYWREVITSRLVDRRNALAARAFEEWLFEQLKANRSWAEITRQLLTAEGNIRYDDPKTNGQAFFLLAQTGPEAVNDRAAETARIFLGIQIRCAQCHDHPFDQWKQVQFHELAGYFARTRDRLIREENRFVGVGLLSLPRGEQEMPMAGDSRRRLLTHPRFLDGKSPGKNLADRARREALADAITDRENYWFASAFANRIWGELMGQAFYEPVDDLGPGKPVVLGDVLVRLAAHFRTVDYDIKALYRTVLNTEAYQRQFQLGDSLSDHNYFAAIYPTQLPADALWSALVSVLGPLERGGFFGRRPGAGGRFGGFGLEAQFRQEFAYDPSASADEVEHTIPQALLLMNNAAIQSRIQADRGSLLAGILETHSQDDEAIRALYLRTLARQPTERERERCLQHIASVGKRAEAFEDILWSLINSTEFQTKK